MSRTLTLAEQLISCPSVVPDTPDGAACLPLLAAHLKTLGFVCDTIDSIPATLRSLGDLGTLRAGNLWAKWTAAQQHQALAAIKTIVFSGHTKLLPTGPLAQWRSPPFTPTQRNGKLYGRGASGMKTSIAAFVVAVEEFLATTPEPLLNIAVLLTGDDEHALADSTKVKPMIEQLKARGLVELANTVWDRGDAFFQPTSWQISNIHGGTGAGNQIPGDVSIDFNFRFSTASSAEGLKQRVHAVLDRHSLEYALQWTLGGQPFLTSPGELVAAMQQAIAAETGLTTELSTSGGTSDGRFIATLCPQVIECGPPHADCHQIDEHIAIADIEPLKNIYRRTLENLHAQALATQA